MCSRPSQRSVFHGHSNHEENRVVLLVAALDRGHQGSWSHSKCVLRRPGRRTRIITRCRCVARGAACQVRHIIEIRAVFEFPTRTPILVHRMNGQHCHHLAVARDYIFASRDREIRVLHNQAVLLQPPVGAVESPECRSDSTRSLQLLIVVEPHSPWARIYTPQTQDCAPLPEVAAGSPKAAINCVGIRLNCEKSMPVARADCPRVTSASRISNPVAGSARPIRLCEIAFPLNLPSFIFTLYDMKEMGRNYKTHATR